MSPEQAAGDQHVDPRSDVYALGCMTFEMLAGEPPFTGATPQAILARKAVESMPSIRVVRETVPAGVERAMQKALAKVPADRWATAGAYAEALKTGLAEQDFTPAEGVVVEGARRRGKLWQVIVGVVVIAAITVGGYVMLGRGDVGVPETAAAPTEAELFRANELYRTGTAKFQEGLNNLAPGSPEQNAFWLEARSDLQEATRLDPNHAEAHAGLAILLTWLGSYGHLPKDSTFPFVRASAERALELDSTLVDVHWALGLSRWVWDWEWQGAYREFIIAYSLDPAGRSAVGYLLSAAQIQLDLGDRGSALSALALAPNQRDTMVSSIRVSVHLYTGDPEGALREATAYAEAWPGTAQAQYWVFRSLLELGQFDEAWSALQDWVLLNPDDGSTPVWTALYHARRGDRDQALRTLDQAREVGKAIRREREASVHAWLGDLDTAFILLEEEFEAQGFVYRFSSDPIYAPLRDDSRFRILLGQMNLDCTYHEDGSHECFQL